MFTFLVSIGSTIAVQYEAETVALLAAFTGTYDIARQNAINTLIKGFKDDDLWANLDRLYVVGLNQADSLLCWKSLTSATNNSMSFVADRGFTGNGSSSYINTSFNPFAASGNFSLDSASLGIWSRTDSSPSLARDMGARTAFNNDEAILLLKEADEAYYALNADSNTAGVLVSSSAGWFSDSRTSSAGVALYQNGTLIASQSLSSSSVPNYSIYIGAVNSGGSPVGFTSRQYSSWLIAGGYDTTKHSSLYSRLNTYLASIGAN